jgi:uncharacterized membrane protein HdeD (DUF308 family)
LRAETDHLGARQASLRFRVLEFVLGVAVVIVGVVALANQSYGMTAVILLLSSTILLSAIRMIANGRRPTIPSMLRNVSLAIGAVMVVVVLVIIIDPALGATTLIDLVAFGLVIQSFGKLLHFGHRALPSWLRWSTVATALVSLALVGITLAFPSLALSTVTILLGSVAIINGLESAVAGLNPQDKRQLTLLKLVLFAALYGFVEINWIDLYGNSVPGYHVWLILEYMAPFGVLIVFQGLKNWQLASSLGLLVSLMNDLGYFIAGDLFFGKQVAILPWLASWACRAGQSSSTSRGAPSHSPWRRG